MTYGGRRLLMEEDFGGRHPLMEDDKTIVITIMTIIICWNYICSNKSLILVKLNIKFKINNILICMYI